MTKRAHFATRLGVIAATVGSSVGLGNIWRFPYEAGNNGGGAFLLCYVLFILLLGIPVICAEFVLGRGSRSNFYGCFTRLGAPAGWKYLGYIGIVASFMILSFYSVVAGLTLEYLWQSMTGSLMEIGESAGGYSAHFSGFVSSPWRLVLWTVLFLLSNYLVVLGGVQKGIERVSNILMPLLFVILVTFCINSLFMSGASKGLRFLFAPDFSKIDGSVVLSALGQAFFSLSIGIGCMLTYASYFNKKTSLVKSAGITAGLDTLVAVLAGVLIFPTVFTYGMSPAEGPTLVFEVFPAIFHDMPFGSVWAVLFFLMLVVASLTSTISMSEIAIAFFTDDHGMTRTRACNVTHGVVFVFAVLSALSFSGFSTFDIAGHTFSFFDFFNNFSSNVLMPVGGMLISVFVGWILDRHVLKAQLTNDGTIHAPWKAVRFLLRYVCPPAIAVILIMSNL